MAKKTKNSDYKLGVSSFIMGLLLLLVVFGGISYMTSNKAENKIYSFNNFPGPKGTIAEGLKMDFNRSNVSCFGLVSFECYINDVDILLLNTSEKVAQIKQIQIGTLTNNGFKSGMYTNLNIQVIGLDLSKESNLTKEISETGMILKELLTPFNIGVKVNMKEFRKFGDKEGDIEVSYNSDILNLSLKGHLITTVVDESIVQVDKNLSITRDSKNAVAEKVFKTGISNILKNFTLNVKNKNIYCVFILDIV